MGLFKLFQRDRHQLLRKAALEFAILHICDDGQGFTQFCRYCESNTTYRGIVQFKSMTFAALEYSIMKMAFETALATQYFSEEEIQIVFDSTFSIVGRLQGASFWQSELRHFSQACANDLSRWDKSRIMEDTLSRFLYRIKTEDLDEVYQIPPIDDVNIASLCHCHLILTAGHWKKWCQENW